MRPAQALDTHTLLAQMCALPSARQYLASLATLNMRLRRPADPDWVRRTLCNHLAVGDTYHLDLRMADAVEQHSQTLREVSQFGDYEPPSACGVLVLDRPWDIDEVSGKTQQANVLTWGPAAVKMPGEQPHSTRMFMLWQDTRRGATDSFSQAILANPELQPIVHQFGGLYPIYVSAMARDTRLGPYLHTVPEDKVRELQVAGRPVAESLRSTLHLIAATFDLMSQSIANLDDDPAERASTRRAKRAGIPSRVTVISLRRNAHSAETGTGTPLAWRIPVKPHTRHYWVRDPATGELVREKRNIETHWRGPEDAPVHVSDKVYTLKR